MAQSYFSNTDNLKMGERSPLEKILDNGFKWFTFAFALSIGLILINIALIVIVAAFPGIREFNFGFFTNSNWNPVTDEYGVIAVVYGTIVSSLIALLIAMHLVVGAAVFLSEDFIPEQIRIVLVFLVELLAAIPSVVYGLWGIFVLIPITNVFGTWLHSNFGWFPLFSSEPAGAGMLPAGILLSIMILPIIIAISRDSLASLPPDLRQASLALGATRWETIFRVLIPSAISGIMGSVMLGLGRAMGETVAATMIIGNANRLSISILDPANTIASLMANQFSEATGLQISALMYAGLILMILTLIVNILAEYIVHKVKAKYE
ncbi:phosphate ABC transporter permease subunit PstC [Geminocystis sp. GBBB08]|uniref:phosphate ABC transporter permease subunit PstC n=1 Tax=Geminocystis sp. GBBB08 TaxID=2604140 RepID=UPI0027E2FCE9|nr:phosphate ABC transporter permease subunit PstC [Geminocystis sp. GBBB08]MBL1208501.1 phosphate ABC transporter permease subunit PstC [Geminocystis sp. GBBB08]